LEGLVFIQMTDNEQPYQVRSSARARTLADELEKAYPTNTTLKLYRFPIVRAAIDLGSKSPAQAVVALEAVAPYVCS
jgi:hypothetical protein